MTQKDGDSLSKFMPSWLVSRSGLSSPKWIKIITIKKYQKEASYLIVMSLQVLCETWKSLMKLNTRSTCNAIGICCNWIKSPKWKESFMSSAIHKPARLASKRELERVRVRSPLTIFRNYMISMRVGWILRFDLAHKKPKVVIILRLKKKIWKILSKNKIVNNKLNQLQ